MKKNDIQRNALMDVLKGITIIMVVITHYAWKKSERLAYGFPFYIRMAVPLFMIISGYCNALSFERCNVITFEEAYNCKSLVRKAIRFAIPIVFVCIAEEIGYVLTGQFQNKEWIDYLYMFLTGGNGPGSYYFPMMYQLLFVFPILYFIVRQYREGG